MWPITGSTRASASSSKPPTMPAVIENQLFVGDGRQRPAQAQACPGRRSSASVSPSGRLLARFDERRSRLIITTLAGKRARSLTFRASLELPRLAWARDDSAVAFEGQAVRDRIYVAERRKGVRVIAQGPFLYGPAWSPDSRLLAFRRCPEAPPSYWRPRWPGCDLMVARRDGSHARLVARHTDTDDLWAGRLRRSAARPLVPERALARVHAEVPDLRHSSGWVGVAAGEGHLQHSPTPRLVARQQAARVHRGRDLRHPRPRRAGGANHFQDQPGHTLMGAV